MNRLLSPATNPAGLTAAGMALYAAIVMITNAIHGHGAFSVPAVVAVVSVVAALYTRQKVTPVADPKDGNGRPLLPALPGRVIPPAEGPKP